MYQQLNKTHAIWKTGICWLLVGRGEILWSQSAASLNNLHHIYRIMQSLGAQHFFALALITHTYLTLIASCDLPKATMSPKCCWLYDSLVTCCVSAGMGAMISRWSKVMIKCLWCSRAWAGVMRKTNSLWRRDTVSINLFLIPCSRVVSPHNNNSLTIQ